MLADSRSDRPLIVQGDHTVLLEADHPLYSQARDALARFAELEKSPEHVHTYRITPLSLWNAAGAGTPLELRMRRLTQAGALFELRDYQADAADAFWAGGGPKGGSGVVVLPCGAGKTVVGMAAMARAGAQTLIVAFGTVAARQWIHELLDKTDITPDMVSEYTGDSKVVSPITVATYQILTYHAGKKRLKATDPIVIE